MQNCEMLHETVVRDIIDVMDATKDFDQVDWLANRNKTGSIARRANNLVLVFPVIVSNSLSIQTATIISKAIERKCVSLLQILFSSIQVSNSNDLQDYLKQFHTNINWNNGVALDDFMGIMDKMVDEGAITVTEQDIYDAVKEDMKNINFTLSTAMNELSINDYIVSKDRNGDTQVYVNEAKRGKNPNYTLNVEPYIDVKPAKNNVNVNPNINISMPQKQSNGSVDDKRVDYFRYQLTTGDVTKANELMPTTMIVNFTKMGDGVKNTTTGIVGVKAKLYPVDAMDIVNRISSKVKDSNGLFNLVRASTREISFFKDLAFAIDKAKVDAINMSRESNNAKIFKILERRAAKNRFMTLLKKNDASPITSLVISQEEVEYLKKYNNVDMDKSYVTRSVLENYNLMDIVIADESLEIAKFLFDDGDGVFEAMSFDALEKESKDNGYKKVLNLMSKMNR